MRYSVTYPNTFSAEQLFAHQSPVPSQYSDMANWPFMPDQPWGISQGGSEELTPPPCDYVLYTYDSRPGQAHDFVADLETFVIPDVPAVFFNPYTVPNGYTAIVRKVEFEFFVSDSLPGTQTLMQNGDTPIFQVL